MRVRDDDTTPEFHGSSSRPAYSSTALPQGSKKRRVAEENPTPSTRSHSDIDNFFQPDDESLVIHPLAKKRKVLKTAQAKESLSSLQSAVTSSVKPSTRRAITQRSTPDVSPSPPPTLLSDSGHPRTPLFLRSSMSPSIRDSPFLDSQQLQSLDDHRIPASPDAPANAHSPKESAGYRDFHASYSNNVPVSNYDAEISWMMDDEPLVPSDLLIASKPYAPRDNPTLPQAKVPHSQPWMPEPAPASTHEDSTPNDQADSNDALADFEAWLSSGNVIITDS